MLRDEHGDEDVDAMLDPETYDPDRRRADDLAAIVRVGGEVLQP